MCPAVPTTIDRMIRGARPTLRFSQVRPSRRSDPFCPSCPSRLPPALAHLPLAPAGPLLRLLLELRLRLASPRSAFTVAHPLEDFDEAEIDLAQFHVDPDH